MIITIIISICIRLLMSITPPINDQLIEIRLKRHNMYLLKIQKEEQLEQEEELLLEQERKQEKEQLEQEKENLLEKERKEQKQKKENIYEERSILNHQKRIDGGASQQLSEEKIPNYRLDNKIMESSYYIIFSLFKNDEIEQHPISEFINKYILNNLNNNIQKIDKNDLFLFYISIKELSLIYDITKNDIKFIQEALSIINMNIYFVDVLIKSNNTNYIQVILQEFVKIIDNLDII